MASGERLGIELQPRDFGLLRGLFESRVMTLAHAAAFYFGSKREMAKKRVQRLKAAGFIREKPRAFSDPSILFLTAKAYALLDKGGHLADFPKVSLAAWEKRSRVSDLTLRHELAVMDVKVSLVTTIAKAERFEVVEFSTWPRLSAFKARVLSGASVVVKPDGFFRVAEHDAGGDRYEHAFFLEVDRSTESHDVLYQRCHAYVDYFRRGGFAVRMGSNVDNYKDFPFRVLLICKSRERQMNLARRLASGVPPIFTQVWLATMDDVLINPLGRIWLQPKDVVSSATPERRLRILTSD